MGFVNVYKPLEFRINNLPQKPLCLLKHCNLQRHLANGVLCKLIYNLHDKKIYPCQKTSPPEAAFKVSNE